MLRYAQKVKRVTRNVEHPFYRHGSCFVVEEKKGPKVLQMQDPDGKWVDVPFVELTEEKKDDDSD
jgi:hypothetical protein